MMRYRYILALASALFCGLTIGSNPLSGLSTEGLKELGKKTNIDIKEIKFQDRSVNC